jgi:hypothetical protein
VAGILLENIKLFARALETGRQANIWWFFYSLFRSECKLIVYLTTMYVYCVYPDLSKKSETNYVICRTKITKFWRNENEDFNAKTNTSLKLNLLSLFAVVSIMKGQRSAFIYFRYQTDSDPVSKHSIEITWSGGRK